MTKEEIIEVIHKTMYQFFDVCGDNEEVPMTDKDELLLSVNKAICNNIKALAQEPCEDCISREAVLAIAGDSCLDLDNYEDTKEFCDEIKDLPPVTPIQRWIPCSERLPEKNMACLVSVGELNFRQLAMYSDLMGIKDHKIFHQGTVGYADFVDITEKVNAWMPLPKPYRAESEK